MSLTYDWRTLATAPNDPRRTEHRPMDRESLRLAAIDLQARGLRVRDIAVVMGINDYNVVELLGTDASGGGP
jgi:hypothetical protein